jgi:glycosyltransferase involved in cell wall biosynthesis
MQKKRKIKKQLKSKTIIIMPAYNAAATLEKTYRDIPAGCYDEIILTDDCSTDCTVEIAKKLGIKVVQHQENLGYGANQKTCFTYCLKNKADIIIMIHPDYQYDPRVISAAIQFIYLNICDIILGCRIRTRKETLQGGMPLYKYVANRFLTTLENFVFGQNIGDFHTGFRIYKRDVLKKINFNKNSNDFIFDTQILAQSILAGFRIGDIPVPTRYSYESSTINFIKSLKYGILTLFILIQYLLHKTKLIKFRIFKNS